MTLPKPCIVCGTATRNGSRCPEHQAHLDAARALRRGTSNDQGYNSKHRRRAAALRAEGLPCAICLMPIDYTLRSPHPYSFTAHHLTPDKDGPIVPACRRCNEQAGKPRWSP